MKIYLIQKEKCNQIAQQFLPSIEKLLKKDNTLKIILKQLLLVIL